MSVRTSFSGLYSTPQSHLRRSISCHLTAETILSVMDPNGELTRQADTETLSVSTLRVLFLLL